MTWRLESELSNCSSQQAAETAEPLESHDATNSSRVYTAAAPVGERVARDQSPVTCRSGWAVQM